MLEGIEAALLDDVGETGVVGEDNVGEEGDVSLMRERESEVDIRGGGAGKDGERCLGGGGGGGGDEARTVSFSFS